MGLATMGRKKRPATDQPRPGPALTIKGSGDWASWVREGAEFCRTDVSKLVDAALIDYLRARGFDKPAPPRT